MTEQVNSVGFDYEAWGWRPPDVVPAEQFPDGDAREEEWRRLIEEAKLDPEWSDTFARGLSPEGEKVKREPEYNPAWENSGFRGEVAKLLWERGLKHKAVRFANCGRLGRPGRCTQYPFEHKFFVLHGCSVIFCRECASEERKRLFLDYLEVILSVMREKGIPEGWTLARVNFTIWSGGDEITPERVKKMNGAVRVVMRKSVGSRKGFGMLFIDETGFELRGRIRNRKAGGLNLHAHGLYFGPYLDWEKTRDLWMRETEKRLGVAGRGFWVKEVWGFRKDPERAVRHALNHMLKYVSKPPAVTPERLASLIAAFDHAKRVHSLGLFYGEKPEREKRDCPCPKCRAMGIPGVVSFEGRVTDTGGIIPLLVPIEDLRADGYELLDRVRRSVFFAEQVLVVSGSGPP